LLSPQISLESDSAIQIYVVVNPEKTSIFSVEKREGLLLRAKLL